MDNKKIDSKHIPIYSSIKSCTRNSEKIDTSKINDISFQKKQSIQNASMILLNSLTNTKNILIRTNTSLLKQSDLGIAICSEQGKRPYQEDEISVQLHLTLNIQDSNLLETHFFGLFDGHAGGKCSKFIANILPNVLLYDESFNKDLVIALKNAFHYANSQFLMVAEKYHLQDGSTGLVVVIRNGEMYIANVGDCRCVLISSLDGNITYLPLSKDQKPTNPEEEKRILELGGRIIKSSGVHRVCGVLAVSRAFGNRPISHVIRPDADIITHVIQPENEYVVMASDGLWDVIENHQVCEIIKKYPSSVSSCKQIASELVKTALIRGSMDNVSCIVIYLKNYMDATNKDKLNRSLDTDTPITASTNTSPSLLSPRSNISTNPSPVSSNEKPLIASSVLYRPITADLQTLPQITRTRSTSPSPMKSMNTSDTTSTTTSNINTIRRSSQSFSTNALIRSHIHSEVQSNMNVMNQRSQSRASNRRSLKASSRRLLALTSLPSNDVNKVNTNRNLQTTFGRNMSLNLFSLERSISPLFSMQDSMKSNLNPHMSSNTSFPSIDINK